MLRNIIPKHCKQHILVTLVNSWNEIERLRVAKLQLLIAKIVQKHNKHAQAYGGLDLKLMLKSIWKIAGTCCVSIFYLQL